MLVAPGQSSCTHPYAYYYSSLVIGDWLMTSLFRVDFAKPGRPEPGTLVPLEIYDVPDSTLPQGFVQVAANGVSVQLAIPAERRADRHYIVYRALELLRAQHPYQRFVLSWQAPAKPSPV